MDGWNTGFLLGWPIFRCKLLVFGRVSCSFRFHPKVFMQVSFLPLKISRPLGFHKTGPTSVARKLPLTQTRGESVQISWPRFEIPCGTRCFRPQRGELFWTTLIARCWFRCHVEKQSHFCHLLDKFL